MARSLAEREDWHGAAAWKKWTWRSNMEREDIAQHLGKVDIVQHLARVNIAQQHGKGDSALECGKGRHGTVASNSSVEKVDIA